MEYPGSNPPSLLHLSLSAPSSFTGLVNFALHVIFIDVSGSVSQVISLELDFDSTYLEERLALNQLLKTVTISDITRPDMI